MTAAAAAEKKRLRDEMYYNFNTSRGMGAVQNRLGHYDKAVSLYSSAIDNAEPGMEVPLIIARSKAQSRLVNHTAAREDALTAIEKAPKDIRTAENDAFTLYEKDDFEDSLVRNYRGITKRKKPDYFYKGILVGKETIEDCIGRNAGPCLDHTTIQLYMSQDKIDTDSDTLATAKRKFERDHTDRFLAQTYLGRLAVDKQFLMKILESPDLKSGNKEHNQQLELLISNMIEKINRNQETLMTRRPMYMLKYHKPKFSEKHEEQVRKEEERWRNGAIKIINRLLEEGETLKEDRNIEGCLSICKRLRKFLDCQPSQILSEKERNKILNKLFIVIGTLYMDTMTFIPTWSDNDNERRIEYILHSNINDNRFTEKVKKTCIPVILNIKEMKHDLESRLSMSKNMMEWIFISYEISRCLIQQGLSEKAYKTALTAYKLAKIHNNTLWAFNTGFLTSLTVLMEGNVDDAKVGFTEVMVNARKLGRDDCASFIQKIIKIANDPDRLDFEAPDTVKHREETILNMMPTPEMRIKANTLLQKGTKTPEQKKLQQRPQKPSRNISQRNSRRSMKVMSQNKRRSLSVVKITHTDAFWESKNLSLDSSDE